MCNEACKTPLVRFMIFSLCLHYYQKQEMLSLELKESHKKGFELSYVHIITSKEVENRLLIENKSTKICKLQHDCWIGFFYSYISYIACVPNYWLQCRCSNKTMLNMYVISFLCVCANNKK